MSPPKGVFGLMRICHIISGDLWAGAEVMVCRLLKNLLNYGDLEITSILLNEGKLAEEVRKLGIPVTVVDETQLNFLQIARNIRRITMQIAPDIIHSHRRKENLLAYVAARSNSDIQMVCTQHGMPEPLMMKYKRLQNAILSRYHQYILMKHFRYVIAVSEDIRNNFIRLFGFQKNKVLIIHNGTEIPVNYSMNRESKDFVIGSAGRLYKIKDYTLMVEIAHEILLQEEDIKFELAGEGPEKENILELIRNYKIEKSFIMKGFVDNMATFYRGIDIFINTSLHEGLPMSILEAMAHGIPVVAPNSGGLPEILNNGSQGYLVDGRNPKMFAEKCLQLYRNKELARKIGTASRERIINNFSVEKMAEKHYCLYKKMITC